MLRERKNILDLTRSELDQLVRAFAGIQKLPADDYFSYFRIAGYNGAPFRGAGWSNPQWWGGYSNHGNVLFPTWHRAYLLRLEQALQSIAGCENVTLPYWNQLQSPKSRDPQPIPPVFLQASYTYQDGSIERHNPLYSYKLQAPIIDSIPSSTTDFSKPILYETVRYPFAGLSGTPDIAATTEHNSKIRAHISKTETDGLLQQTVQTWLQNRTSPLRDLYLESLSSPNYTVFSNTTSAQAYNSTHSHTSSFTRAVPLETPSSGIHLALGGIETPGSNHDAIPNSTGDMGELDTAALDPIFFFHHAFLDLLFWKWQKTHRSTSKLDIIPHYPGTNSSDGLGPTPGIQPNTWLTLDTPLAPFSKEEGESEFLTSRDFINIEHLNWDRTHFHSYTYSLPPLPSHDTLPNGLSPKTTSHLLVTGINKSSISGSFVVSAWAVNGRDEKLVGYEPVLNRWHTSSGGSEGVRCFFPLKGMEGGRFVARVHAREGELEAVCSVVGGKGAKGGVEEDMIDVDDE